MEKLKVILIGAGNRGTTYAMKGKEHCPEFELVAVADPKPNRRNYIRDMFDLPESACYESWEDILAQPELELLAVSEQAGVFAVKSENNRRFFVTGHPEYDPDTLSREYFRDVDKGLDIDVPANYFPDDDPSQAPIVRWRSAAQLFYNNWLNYYVYQTTPYDLDKI